MDHRHPMRVVARRTGMSPHLIRMWERRYAAVTPARTSTGHRLYSDGDIERLNLLHRATLEGEAISQIARLSREQLLELISGEDAGVAGELESRVGVSVDKHLQFCLQSMQKLDAVALETRLLRASIDLDQRAFLEKLLQPLLELTGEMWSDGQLMVAHEHLASAVVRSLLGSMYLSNTSGAADPLLVSTTPQGQLHEFGALIVSVTAAACGWGTLYLGSNLPAEDIAEAAMSRHANAIALSIVFPADDRRLSAELRRIHTLVEGKIPMLVGGRSAIAYDEALSEIGAVRVGGLAELRSELRRLKRGVDSI